MTNQILQGETRAPSQCWGTKFLASTKLSAIFVALVAGELDLIPFAVMNALWIAVMGLIVFRVSRWEAFAGKTR